MAVAEASFRTVKLSISLGLMDERGLLVPLIPSFDTGSPSITIRGSFDALRDEPPRIRMVDPEPGAPSPVVTTTPADFPLRISVGDVAIP